MFASKLDKILTDKRGIHDIIKAMKPIHSLQNSISIFADTYRHLQKSKTSDESIQTLKMKWADDILKKLNVQLEVKGSISDKASTIFIGNHIGYLDIPLLMAKVNDISFVAKEELQSWPLFGEAAKKIGTVFVKRENKTSRRNARESVQSAIKDGKRVVIFPSGTTCMYESKPWKKGAFEIAHNTNSFIQPFRITYQPMRSVAYIDQDFFPIHLYNLCGFEKIKAHIEFHEPIKVEDPSFDCIRWNYWSRGLIE